MIKLVLAGVVFALVLAAVGYEGASQWMVFAGAGAACGALGLWAAARRWPVHALSLTPLLVLVAATKFRERDPLLSMSGHVDAQIGVELGLYAVIGLITLAALASREFRPSRLGMLEKAAVAFGLLALASTLWSPTRGFTFVRAAQLVLLTLLVVIAVRTMDPGRYLRVMARTVVGYVLVASALSLSFHWARAISMGPHGQYRFSWFAVHPIQASTMAALAALLLIAEFEFSQPSERARPFKVPLLACLGLMLVVLAATVSRGALVSFVAAGGFLVAWRRLRVWAALTLGAGLITIVMLFSNQGSTVGSLLQDAATSRSSAAYLLMRGQSAQQLEGMTGRITLWEQLLPLIEESPVVGHGYQASRPLILEIAVWAGHAHNAYLESLLDLGIAGAVLLWLPLLAAFAIALRERDGMLALHRWQPAALLGLLTFTLVYSVPNEESAGSASFTVLVVIACTVMADRFWLAGRAPAPAAARVPAPDVASARRELGIPAARPIA